MPPMKLPLLLLLSVLGLVDAISNGTGQSIYDTVPNGGSTSGDGFSMTVGNRTTIEIGQLPARSGLPTWVDPETPADRQLYISSRGQKWELVMSDEFSNPLRNFTPGNDHMWTSLEKPDGVNGAVEYLSHNMTYIQCDPATETNPSTSTNASAHCYFTIKVKDEITRVRVYNMYARPPGFQTSSFYYRAGMVQSWNKFCFQGGMLEVRAQLPGAINAKSKNPDMQKSPFTRVTSADFYPTWPGIWMMGNLGRAVFSGSTNRMWPFSYNECNPKAFDTKSQRISACNGNPGHGLNPYQGRGAPEIDLLEGGGDAISSSIQIGPGLKTKYRRFPVDDVNTSDFKYCVYGNTCVTPGANLPNVPKQLYQRRGYPTWYKGLRYSANPFCERNQTFVQYFEEVNASIANGVNDNKCTLRTCSASRDVQADLGLIPNDPLQKRWGINSKGTCFAVMNNYMGSYLCDPDNINKLCLEPRNATTPKTNVMKPFNYQMDALSANWGIHVGAYTSFVTYQVEWVLGEMGYVRWMIEGNPVYEIPAQSLVKGPQLTKDPNPRLTFPEEPMYIIFNVALSSQWGAMPPNVATGACRGNGKDQKANRICDGFPMYLKIDYVRLYQDRSPNSTMAIGCDPKSHPTRRWILDHREEYEDQNNKMVEVTGGAACRDDDDCTVRLNATINSKTGVCVNKRCQCTSEYWTGPRCTLAVQIVYANSDDPSVRARMPSYGPPLYLAIMVGVIGFASTCVIVVFCSRRHRRRDVELKQKLDKLKEDGPDMEKAGLLAALEVDDIERSRNASSTPLAKYQPMMWKAKSDESVVYKYTVDDKLGEARKLSVDEQEVTKPVVNPPPAPRKSSLEEPMLNTTSEDDDDDDDDEEHQEHQEGEQTTPKFKYLL